MPNDNEKDKALPKLPIPPKPPDDRHIREGEIPKPPKPIIKEGGKN